MKRDFLGMGWVLVFSGVCVLPKKMESVVNDDISIYTSKNFNSSDTNYI